MKCAKYNICVINHWACHWIDFWSATFWATGYGAVEALGEGGGLHLLLKKEEKLYFSQQQKHGISAILNPTAVEQWLEPSL